jgi:hypothetical protein
VGPEDAVGPRLVSVPNAASGDATVHAVMDSPTLPSRVTAVTVFRRGALVTRTATVTRDAGGFPSTVRLEGLPLLLDDESLQVELRAEPTPSPASEPAGTARDGRGAVPLAGDLRVTLAVPEPDAELRPPSDGELDAAKLELALAQQAQADLELMGACVSSLAPGGRGTPEEGQPPMVSPIDARLALLALRRERLEQLAPRLQAATERTRLAGERLETLRERERRASQARNPRSFEARKAVVVGLLSAGEPAVERLQLCLRYFVPGARWAPSYVLRLDPTLGGGTLELRALVGQATGERWTDVALTLSTAHPQQWTELPELRSLRIGRRQPPPPKTGWRPPPPGTGLLYADYDRVRPPEPPPPASQRSQPPALGVAGFTRTEAGNYTQAGTVARTVELDLDLEEIQAIAEEASGAYGLPEPQAAMPEHAKRAKGRSSNAPPRPGAPPMRMPMPMQVAAPAAMTMSESRSAGIGGMLGNAFDGLFGGGGGAPAPQGFADDEDGFGGPGSPSALVADRAQLEYGSLWLPPPDDARRGSLQRADQAQRYGRLASLAPEQIAAALAGGLTALVQAQAFEHRDAPGGHQWANGSEGFDYAYEAQAHVDLDCDGDLHGLPLQSCPVEATPRYISVPRETQDVFRVVVLRNPIDAPLLPGPVDVYLGGRFALASALEVTPPRGRVELGLGVEQAIKIARNTTFEEEASGLLKRHRDLEHRVRVEVSNHLERPATVEVRERLPVTRDGESDIEVVERSIEPPWEDLKQEDPPLAGGRAWKVEVPAGGERKLQATFSIRIPQNHEIVGGNRREG